jgi:hypothetical protein
MPSAVIYNTTGLECGGDFEDGRRSTVQLPGKSLSCFAAKGAAAVNERAKIATKVRMADSYSVGSCVFGLQFLVGWQNVADSRS